MANKQAKFTYRGLNQDVTKSKHPFEFYYDSKNIRIINTDSQDSYSVTNEKGNTKVLDIPSIYITYDEQNGNRYNKLIKYNDIELPFISDELIDSMPNSTNSQVIIGHVVTRDSIILLSTDDNKFDCVWEVTELLEGGFDLKLLYCRDLNFSTESPIQILYNYENDKIQKIYWVDGVNQLRFINIKHSIEYWKKSSVAL